MSKWHLETCECRHDEKADEEMLEFVAAQLSEAIERAARPRSPIEVMIDAACGVTEVPQ